MIPIPSQAIETVLATRYGWLVAAIFVVAMSWVVVLAVDDTKSTQERNAAALALWTQECAKPIEACAKDWDDSYTLRNIYRARVEGVRG